MTGERVELPTVGAYSVAAVDLTENGRLDLIISSAWVDHHNPGESRLLQVFEQNEPRQFTDATERHRIMGVAPLYVICEDLTGVAYTYDDKPETMAHSSVVYYGSAEGSHPSAPRCCRLSPAVPARSSISMVTAGLISSPTTRTATSVPTWGDRTGSARTGSGECR